MSGAFPQLECFSLRLSRLAIAVFCDQHYPETCLPSHHLRIGSGCLIEWDGLDHRGYTAQRTEPERCITSRRISCQRARYLAFSEYQVHARYLDRLRSNAEVNRNSAGTKAFERLGDCFTSRSCYENDFGSAEGLQCRCWIGGGAVYVVMSTELLCELGCVAAKGNRRHLEPHVPGVLHRQMTKAADTEHCDKITRLCRSVNQSIESR